jgi:LAO/AO transport system kinase
MKKGVLELADLLVVNKADGDQLEAARRAQIAYQHALSLLRPASPKWRPPVLLACATSGDGIAGFWETVRKHRDALAADGAFEARRSEQARAWLWTLLDEGLQRGLRQHPAVARALPRLEAEVAARKTSPGAGARELLELYAKG